MAHSFKQFLATAVSLLFLAGCSSTPLQYNQLNKAEFDSVELSETPFFPQEAYQCGPAALATVLYASGIEDITTARLTEQVYLPDRQGSLQTELVAATRRADRVPYVLAPRLEHLLEEVAAGHPVIVLQNLRISQWPVWHYAVVIGYNLENKEVILRSGTTEREVMSFRHFEHTWRLGDYWALVVTEPDSIPETARPIPYLAAVSAVEEQGRWGSATAGYRAAMKRWSDNYTPVFGLGNIAFRQGDYLLAEDYYYQAAELAPEEPSIYFNLAWALKRQEKHKSALEAAKAAAVLAPEHDRYGRAPELIQAN